VSVGEVFEQFFAEARINRPQAARLRDREHETRHLAVVGHDPILDCAHL